MYTLYICALLIVLSIIIKFTILKTKLIQCKACLGEISNTAYNCPKCGARYRARFLFRRFFKRFAIIIFLIGLVPIIMMILLALLYANSSR
jgi:hypothetical protein